MNKNIFLLLLLLSSCSFFSKKKINSTSVITNISINHPLLRGVDLKLKTDLYSDSAVIQVSPIVGLNLATILVKDESIYVNNKLNNEETTFSVLDFDPDFSFKKLLKLAIKNKEYNDTAYYKTPNVNYVFTDYVKAEIINSNNKIIYLPRFVNIDRPNDPISQNTNSLKIIIDYKLVKLNK